MFDSGWRTRSFRERSAQLTAKQFLAPEKLFARLLIVYSFFGEISKLGVFTILAGQGQSLGNFRLFELVALSLAVDPSSQFARILSHITGHYLELHQTRPLPAGRSRRSICQIGITAAIHTHPTAGYFGWIFFGLAARYNVPLRSWRMFRRRMEANRTGGQIVLMVATIRRQRHPDVAQFLQVAASSRGVRRFQLLRLGERLNGPSET
ncbi:MAG: hypothetical protein QOH67_402 [Hyphomicrobiales bacterium]|nr:hypothetical protein [Hyphomicrobiales bacterium]